METIPDLCHEKPLICDGGKVENLDVYIFHPVSVSAPVCRGSTSEPINLVAMAMQMPLPTPTLVLL